MHGKQRGIRKFSENIHLKDGVLFYVQLDDKEQQNVKSKRQWISDEKKQKYYNHYMMILLVDAILGVIKPEIKFVADISGMGNAMILTSTSRPVTSAGKYV